MSDHVEMYHPASVERQPEQKCINQIQMSRSLDRFSHLIGGNVVRAECAQAKRRHQRTRVELPCRNLAQIHTDFRSRISLFPFQTENIIMSDHFQIAIHAE